MIFLFPELIICKGWLGEQEHWWCKTKNGSIVDPTKHQQSFMGTFGKYREYKDGDEIKVGKCMNCGDNIFGLQENGRRDICGSRCEQEFINYQNENPFGI